jgi:phosphopantetheinyl transferase
MLERVCTTCEAAYILAADNREEAFSRFWTLKEAYAKYTGEGLALDFSKLDFSFGEQDEILFQHPKANAVQFFQIRFHEYNISLCCGAGETETDGRILLC